MPKMIGYQEQVDGLVLIGEVTASGVGTLSMDIPAGYHTMEFHYYNMHPATNQVDFMFQVNAVGQSGFNETITSAAFTSSHFGDDTTLFRIEPDDDQAQGTGYQTLVSAVGSGADESCAGILHLFTPSNTTFVTHFYARFICHGGSSDVAQEEYVSGYINITSAVDEISFKVDSGNFDGVIQMYGIA